MSKKRRIFSFTFLQAIVCFFIMLLAILLKFVDSNTFYNLRDFYNTKLNEKITFGQEEVCCNAVIESFFLGKDDSKNVKFINRSSGVTAPYTDFSLSFASPVDEGVITSKFGLRNDPFTGEKDNHSGLDIAANKNSEIHNVMVGTVEKVAEDSAYGNYVVINHGNGIKTLYAHCEKILVSPDDKVSRSQPIALVGSTGRATGDHLHLEVIINDIKYNPEPLLSL